MPELAIVALGVALRWTMRTSYDYRWSYDFTQHLAFIRWVADSFSLPSLDLTREAYHPPLYYFVAGFFMRIGVGESRLGTISIVCGVLRLLVLWAVFARWLGRSTLAMRVALLVAALQPTSIHLDGMATGEGLSNLLAAVAMWIVPPLFLDESRVAPDGVALPWRRAASLGLVLGFGLLTKLSALAIAAAFGVGLVARVFWIGRDARRIGWRSSVRRLRRVVAVWVIVGIVIAAVSGWYFMRNQRLYHKPFLSGFDGPDRTLMKDVAKTPTWARRPASYYVCWSNQIYGYPYYPSGVRPESCFWPQLVASSWVDFYRYGFANGEKPGALRTPIIQTARASVAGGTVLGLCAALTTFLLLVRAWRRRDAALLALLMVPVIALAGQVYFATAFPIDGQGMVKGLYMQFASPPLYATIGVALAWLWRRRRVRPVALMLIASIVFVGSYAATCRFLPAPPHVGPGGRG